MAPPLTIGIQTFSDTVCPWSYIGKKNLDNAIEKYKEQHPDVEFKETWNPFYLNPEAKTSAYNKKEYYASMFGPARAAAWFDRVNDRASALGVSINWDGLAGNTRDSHVLLLLAQKQQQEQEDGSNNNGNNILRDTEDALFRGVFDRGRDVSDREFLAEVALEVGLCESEEEVVARLDSPEARAQADALDRAAKKVAGITAVPSYVVQGRYSVGGQQNSEVFLQLFDRIRLEGKGGQ